MKPPLSLKDGRKYWLAKATERKNEHSTCFFCPEPKAHLLNKDYSFTPADFDPRGISRKDAIKLGKDKSIFNNFGERFGSQIWNMAHEASVGDVIFLETLNRHLHAWGVITRRYEYRPVKVLRKNELEKRGLHSVGVEWHEVMNGHDAFKAVRRSDNLAFREITDKKELLETLRSHMGQLPAPTQLQAGAPAPQDLEYLEGGKVLQTHLRTERDGKIARLAKELARKRHRDRKLVCEVCKSVPQNVYGELNLDLIEAHHRIPLAQGVRETKPEDFAMLCPCCHRAVHKLIKDKVDPIAALTRLSKLFT